MKAFFKKGTDTPQKLLVGFEGMKYNKKGVAIENEATFHRVYGAFAACRVCDFDQVGGYNTLMSGWGYKDNDFRNRMVKAGAKEQVLPHRYNHLWHPSSVDLNSDARNRHLSKITYFDGVKWKIRN